MTGDSISGRDAAELGLVLKSVPADALEAEVEGLADRFALVDIDVLSASKRICNIGLKLMGASSSSGWPPRWRTACTSFRSHPDVR